MTAELERIKTTCLAQEAEIARLQAGFDELKERCVKNMPDQDGEFHDGFYCALKHVVEEINRITGESE